MAEEQGTPEAVEASIESQPVAVEAPAVEPTPETEDPEAGLFSLLKERPDVLNKYLETLSDEDSSKIPVINRRVDKYVSKKSKELEQKYSKETEERNQAQQWMSNWHHWANDPERTPGEVAQAAAKWAGDIARHTATLAKVAPRNDAQALIARAEEGFRTLLKEALPEVEDWEDVSKPEEIKERVQRAKEKMMEETKKELEASWEKRLQAEVSKLKAQINLSADQPDKLSSDGRASGETRVTRQQISEMSEEEYKKFRGQLAGTRR